MGRFGPLGFLGASLLEGISVFMMGVHMGQVGGVGRGFHDCLVTSSGEESKLMKNIPLRLHSLRSLERIAFTGYQLQ